MAKGKVRNDFKEVIVQSITGNSYKKGDISKKSV